MEGRFIVEDSSDRQFLIPNRLCIILRLLGNCLGFCTDTYLTVLISCSQQSHELGVEHSNGTYRQQRATLAAQGQELRESVSIFSYVYAISLATFVVFLEFD